MTKPDPLRPVRRAERIVAAAYALTRDPHNMEARRRFVSETFNLDYTAEAIVTLAHMEPMQEPPE